jgi:tight adherence protein C
MNPSWLAVCAAVTSAVMSGLVHARLRPPPPRLSRLIRADIAAEPGQGPGSAWETIGAWALPHADGAGLRRLLRQAGLTRGIGADRALAQHLAQRVASAAVLGLLAGLATRAAGAGGSAAAAALAAGAVAGALRERGRVERIVERRCERLRIELYTVNQLLALDVRAGAGVQQALDRVARRGRGIAADEIREVLTAARAGLPLAEALRQAARLTPEPAAARTYRLLAKGAEYGVDLAAALRALSEDLRTERAEALERTATRGAPRCCCRSSACWHR